MKDDKFSLFAMVGGRAPPVAQAMNLLASTPGEVVAKLENAALLVQKYALPAVRGEPSAFEEARNFSQALARERGYIAPDPPRRG